MQELESWTEEKRSAYLYRIIADIETNPIHKTLFASLAKEAEKQAQIWESVIRKRNISILKVYTPDIRTHIVAKLIPYFGTRRLRHILTTLKVRGLSVYLNSHPGHPIPIAVSEIGKGHRSVNEGGNLRAGVFGINDGLISNFSLLMGLAGANSEPRIVILSGVAAALAGAFSMAAGEYISVRSQREMYEHQIALESEELKQYPEAEGAELALIYEARGLPKVEAQKIAMTIIKDPKKALDTLTREELGLNPEELGLPIQVAFFSFIFFSLGSIVPLLPFLLGHSGFAVSFSAIFSGIALFSTGAVLSLFTGRNAMLSGLRMLTLGAVAGSVTYLVGHYLGTLIS